MNATMRRALLLDSVYQVLDNRVFRILLGTVLLLVFLTFAIGFREEEIVLLFGWKSYPYERIIDTFELPLPAGFSEREGLIRLLQKIFVDSVAGSLGITFAIAATAFFIPRMLEKGLADGLFSKPISRASFYLACYLTGVGFVGALAVVLVCGMHVGLLVSSGYSDPGFLWGALTLTYVFAIVHAVSMLIGVFTRSSVAALLLALLFFMVNGCIHGGWTAKEGALQNEEFQRFLADLPPEPGKEREGPPVALVDGLITTLDVLHYVLPKTTEGELITELLRVKITRSEPDFFDPESKLRIQKFAPGTRADRERPAPEVLDLSIATSAARFMTWLRVEEAEDDVRLWLERAPGLSGGRSMSEAMEKRLRDKPGIGKVRRDRTGTRQLSARTVQWEHADDGEVHSRRVFVTSGDEGIVALCLDARADWVPPDADKSRLAEKSGADLVQEIDAAQFEFLHEQFETLEFDEGGNELFGGGGNDPTRHVRQRFGWTAEWKYNAWFSIGSSVAFTALMLLLGIWRMRRIDF
ncbi:MAG: ABC transporter permease [Planctomycetes bacterium]|nr:ABC transporter permease [Planctomycetota bacterium]